MKIFVLPRYIPQLTRDYKKSEHAELDKKPLPFAIEEFGDQCWGYGSSISHGDRLCGAVDVFLKRDDIREESKRNLLVANTARFYGL